MELMDEECNCEQSTIMQEQKRFCAGGSGTSINISKKLRYLPTAGVSGLLAGRAGRFNSEFFVRQASFITFVLTGWEENIEDEETKLQEAQ